MNDLAPPAVLTHSHVGIFVRELAPMEHFYTRALGMVVTERRDLPTGSLVFLSRDPCEHHQLVLREPLDLSCDDDALVRLSEAQCRVAPGFKPMREWRAETAARIEQARLG